MRSISKATFDERRVVHDPIFRCCRGANFALQDSLDRGCATANRPFQATSTRFQCPGITMTTLPVTASQVRSALLLRDEIALLDCGL